MESDVERHTMIDTEIHGHHTLAQISFYYTQKLMM